MFEITLNGQTLYHPNALDCNVTNAVIHEKLNDAGYMDITIPYSNPVYNELTERKGKIVVYKDNVELWYGELRDISTDFSKNKTLYVVGEASYLNDTVQPQRELKGTKYQILQEILNHHNSMVESDKEFQPGAIGNNATAQRTVVTDWEYTLDAIREHLCDEEEYVRIRHVAGVRYVDIMPLENYGKHSDQVIRFGENLLDYVEDSSGEDIATICIPLGSTQEDGGIEGYENYTTCESANGGKNYVELQGAINRLGRITKVVHFNVLSDPSALKTAALNYLQTSQYAKLSLKLTAIDLSIMHSDIDNYAVGDYAQAISEPMGMDAWFPVRERETDIINIANNKIVMGASGTKSFTAQQMESVDSLEKAMPNRDSILKSALKNAGKLINSNGENGNVSIRTDENGEPYEILIMNAKSIEDSTQAWRWNLSGFGHGTKTKGDPDFSWEPNVAITMDGSIIAEKGSIANFNINTGKALNGQKTDYLEITGLNGSYFRLGNQVDTGKSFAVMEYKNPTSGNSYVVGMYEDYILVSQKDSSGNTKSTEITPTSIKCDGDIGSNIGTLNGALSSISSLSSGINAAIATANNAGDVANSAVATANRAGELAAGAYDYADNWGAALNARCDAIVNLIKIYHPS